ncbi:hypothetical protein [Curtobacterium flaccumfaciens]|uniref:hypothetical protein n=1 Tax=Curtobacterium flaccumfaciens TaxID=2035 RepID=UPI001266CFD8|nr:hypothetical protein [Curtobacterium flaccumfaciens]MBT1666643.1 hypothetical protein [Curtobacterium flaccumfaciens pv. flaccumfaciens]QFS78722.1 hypothetical protein GBG65_02220 [Curtobacterium flaccumfaciens pv. flaccumfaciens]
MTNEDVRAVVRDIIHRADADGSGLPDILEEYVPDLPGGVLAKQVGAQIATFVSSTDEIKFVDFFAWWNEEEQAISGKYEVITETLLISAPFSITKTTSASGVTATATARRRADITEVRVNGAGYPIGSTEPWPAGVTVTVAGVGWEIKLAAQRLGATELGQLIPSLLG